MGGGPGGMGGLTVTGYSTSTGSSPSCINSYNGYLKDCPPLMMVDTPQEGVNGGGNANQNGQEDSITDGTESPGCPTGPNNNGGLGEPGGHGGGLGGLGGLTTPPPVGSPSIDNNRKVLTNLDTYKDAFRDAYLKDGYVSGGSGGMGTPTPTQGYGGVPKDALCSVSNSFKDFNSCPGGGATFKDTFGMMPLKTDPGFRCASPIGSGSGNGLSSGGVPVSGVMGQYGNMDGHVGHMGHGGHGGHGHGGLPHHPHHNAGYFSGLYGGPPTPTGSLNPHHSHHPHHGASGGLGGGLGTLPPHQNGLSSYHHPSHHSPPPPAYDVSHHPAHHAGIPSSPSAGQTFPANSCMYSAPWAVGGGLGGGGGSPGVMGHVSSSGGGPGGHGSPPGMHGGGGSPVSSTPLKPSPVVMTTATAVSLPSTISSYSLKGKGLLYQYIHVHLCSFYF